MATAREIQVGDVLRLAAGDGRVVRVEPLSPTAMNVQVIPAGSALKLSRSGSPCGARWLGFFPGQQVTILTRALAHPEAIGPRPAA